MQRPWWSSQIMTCMRQDIHGGRLWRDALLHSGMAALHMTLSRQCRMLSTLLGGYSVDPPAPTIAKILHRNSISTI
jgi:hypothetical protein